MTTLTGAISSTQRARYDYSFLPDDRLRQIAVDLRDVTSPFGAAWVVQAYTALVPPKLNAPREISKGVLSKAELAHVRGLKTEEILSALEFAATTMEHARTTDDDKNLTRAIQLVREELAHAHS